MTENQPKKKKRGRNLSLFILLVLALSCCGLYALGSGSGGSSSASTNVRSGGSSASATDVTISFTPIRLNGRGDDVVRFDKPDVPAIIHLTHQGSSNFAVHNYDGSGEQIDLLVNEIGQYDGIRPLDFGIGEWTDRLEIKADGAWTAVIEPITAAEAISIPNSRYSGQGDAVLRLIGSDPDTATLSHSGDSNFVVQAYGSSDRLLVNEIGEYSGTVIVPRDTVVIEVIANGNWQMAITGQ